MTAHSQTAQDLFEELVAEQLRQPGVVRRRMFGREGLNVNGKFFAFLNHDQLVLKLPPTTATALITAGEALTGESLSRTMRYWVSIPMSATPANHHRWRQLMAEAHDYAVGNQNDSSGATVDAPDQHNP
jgi:TfoX/Sxy family transcriptional regulator of competence genes